MNKSSMLDNAVLLLYLFGVITIGQVNGNELREEMKEDTDLLKVEVLVDIKKGKRVEAAEDERPCPNGGKQKQNSKEEDENLKRDIGQLKKIEKLNNKTSELEEEKEESLYNRVKGEMNNQKTLYNSENSSIIEKKKKIDEILHKLDEMDRNLNPKQILVMGGWNGTQSSSDMFLLDYYGKTWKQVNIKLPNNTHSHGTVILDDQLYIIGGTYGSNYYNTLYRLNKQMKWEKLADMHEKRGHLGSSCLVHNGSIWVIGGWNGDDISSNTMEKYDPATNRWEKKAMKRRRSGAAAAVINNKIYVCGGYDGYSQLDSVDVFNIESEVWTDFNTLPAPKSGMSIIVDGTSIILIEYSVWRMDVEDRNTKWINIPPLNEGRYGSSAIRINTESILVVGGCVKDHCKTSSSSVEIFDGHKWETVTPLPEPRGRHTSVVLTPAMIYAFRPFVQK